MNYIDKKRHEKIHSVGISKNEIISRPLVKNTEMTKKQLISPLETEGCHIFEKHFKHQKVRPA